MQDLWKWNKENFGRYIKYKWIALLSGSDISHIITVVYEGFSLSDSDYNVLNIIRITLVLNSIFDSEEKCVASKKEIDLATMWNILLWYNAKELWLSLHETVMGAIFAQADVNTILSKDSTVAVDEIYKISRDKAGRMVFLDKGTVTTADKLWSWLDHTIKEIKPGNITRYEQFRSGDNPVIPDGEDIENLIDKVISNYDGFTQTSNGKAMYTKKIGDKNIFIIINESSGKIITITP